MALSGSAKKQGALSRGAESEGKTMIESRDTTCPSKEATCPSFSLIFSTRADTSQTAHKRISERLISSKKRGR